MQDLEDFFSSVKKAYEKTGGVNWPAKGKQLTNSYIKLAAKRQFDLFREVEKKISKKDAAGLFWSPTQIRYILTGEFIIGLKLLSKEAGSPSSKEITSSVLYALSLLKEKTSSDPFCLNGNNAVYSPKEINSIIGSNDFVSGDLGLAKRLSAVLASFSWAFGFDTHFANIMDVHGPYDCAGEKMLVREFDFSAVNDVWGIELGFPKRIRIYLLYSNSDLSIDWELHIESKDSLDLLKYKAVSVVDGVEQVLSSEKISEIISLASEMTVQQVKNVDALSVLDKIRKGALLSYYQTKCLSEFLGEDWKPGAVVEEAIITGGESNWFAKPAVKKQGASFDSWIVRFDPRVPLND